MAQTGIAFTKTTGAAAAGIVSLRAAGAARDLRVFEVGIFATTAVAGEVGLGRPATAGTSSANTGAQASGNSYDNVVGAGAALVDTAWSVAPTAPTLAWRRVQLPATIGAGIIWTFPKGIVVPANGGTIILWQFSAAAVGYDGYFDFDE